MWYCRPADRWISSCLRTSLGIIRGRTSSSSTTTSPFSTTAATRTGTVTRRIGTPAARMAVSSLNRLIRRNVNAAATTGMMPLICVKIRKHW